MKETEQQQRLTLNKPILKASKQDQDWSISKSKQIMLGKFLIHFYFLGLLQTFGGNGQTNTVQPFYVVS